MCCRSGRGAALRLARRGKKGVARLAGRALRQDRGMPKKSGCIGLRLFPNFTQFVDRTDLKTVCDDTVGAHACYYKLVNPI